MKTMFLYGIAGAEEQYRVVRYTCIPEEDFSVLTFKYEALKMRMEYPNIERVFMMDNRHGLRRDYVVACKKNSIENWIAFKDMLERQGIEIPV